MQNSTFKLQVRKHTVQIVKTTTNCKKTTKLFQTLRKTADLFSRNQFKNIKLDQTISFNADCKQRQIITS